MFEEIQKQCTAVIIAVCSLSCGGGAGDTEGNTNPSGDGVTDNGATTLNNGLSGSLLFEHNDSAYLLNASTGKYAQISNTNWNRYDEIFPKPDSASFYIMPAYKDRTEYLIQARNCDHSFGDILTCIVIQDYDGNFHEGFSTWDTVLGARLSHDRQYIALYRRLAEDWLEIYRRNGELISSTQVIFNHFSWLQDGRILYASNRSFVFTNQNTTSVDYTLTLPDNIEQNARIGRISVSPDESKIVFELAADSVRPYIMNIDGTDIRRLADMPSGSNYINIVEPQWSPDGNWILLKQGASAVVSRTAGTLPSLFLVPSRDLGKTFILSKSTSERSPEVVEFYRYENLNNTGSITYSALSETNMYWIP